jgi:hypothetical protein
MPDPRTAQSSVSKATEFLRRLVAGASDSNPNIFSMLSAPNQNDAERNFNSGFTVR